jgi:hypothetical protein
MKAHERAEAQTEVFFYLALYNSLTLRPLYLWGKLISYPLSRRLNVPEVRSRLFRKQKSFFSLPEKKLWYLVVQLIA